MRMASSGTERLRLLRRLWPLAAGALLSVPVIAALYYGMDYVASDGDRPTGGLQTPEPNGMSRTQLVATHFFERGRAHSDARAALPLLKRALALGHAGACYEIGVLYYKGQERFPEDHGEAVRWFRRGAQMGDPLSMQALGWAYYKGIGGASDLEQALLWLKRASDAGLPSAKDAHFMLEGKHWSVYRSDGTQSLVMQLPINSEGIWRVSLIWKAQVDLVKSSVNYIWHEDNRWLPAREFEEPYFWTGTDWASLNDVRRNQSLYERLLREATVEHDELAQVWNPVNARLERQKFSAQIASAEEDLRRPGLDERTRTNLERKVISSQNWVRRIDEQLLVAPGSVYPSQVSDTYSLENAKSFRGMALESRKKIAAFRKRADEYRDELEKLPPTKEAEERRAELEKAIAGLEQDIRDKEELLKLVEAHFK